MRKNNKSVGMILGLAVVASLGVVALGVSNVHADSQSRAFDGFFDWGAQNATASPLGFQGPSGTLSGYVGAIPLNNSNTAQVIAFLTAQQTAGKPLAIQVQHGVALTQATINPVFNSSGRYCGGPGTDSTTEANFQGGTTPAGLTFIENTNFRAFPTTCSTCSPTQEGVAPGLKP